MREILFRGKRTDGRGWVEGYLIRIENYCCILELDCQDYGSIYLDWEIGWIDGQAIPVIPETVGQYTGLKDKNGKNIFEGDIVKTKFGRLCVVVWFSSPSFTGFDLSAVQTADNVVGTYAPTPYDMWSSECLEIIGNIHDDPELMEAKKNEQDS